MTVDRKALIREYKQAARPMGVYRVTDSISGQSLVGWSLDLPARLNRHRAAFESGAHPEKDFQRAWNAITARRRSSSRSSTRSSRPTTPAYNPADDLKTLEQMWIDKLAPNARRRAALQIDLAPCAAVYIPFAMRLSVATLAVTALTATITAPTAV